MAPQQAMAFYPNYPSYGPSSAPTWDPSALANYFNSLSLHTPSEWVMDTGASAHMSSDDGNLTSLSPNPPHKHVIVGDGTSLSATHYGHVNFPAPTSCGRLSLRDVLVTPRIINNLIFVHQFTTGNHCSIELDPWDFSVKDLRTGP
jgi:hypothetical protein